MHLDKLNYTGNIKILPTFCIQKYPALTPCLFIGHTSHFLFVLADGARGSFSLSNFKHPTNTIQYMSSLPPKGASLLLLSTSVHCTAAFSHFQTQPDQMRTQMHSHPCSVSSVVCTYKHTHGCMHHIHCCRLHSLH